MRKEIKMAKSKIASAPPCPFWRAASTDQRAIDPDAPAPLKADELNKISAAIEHLIYHGGFPRWKATGFAQALVMAANKGAGDKLRGLFTQSFTPNELNDGLLDKELNSGVLRRTDPEGVEHAGEFSEENMAKMFSPENASEVVIDGRKELAMTRAQLGAFVTKNRSSTGANFVHTIMNHVELKDLLLGIFGRRADDGEKVLTKKDIEVFYGKGIFPHARLDDPVAQAFPSEFGAAPASHEEPSG